MQNNNLHWPRPTIFLAQGPFYVLSKRFDSVPRLSIKFTSREFYTQLSIFFS